MTSAPNPANEPQPTSRHVSTDRRPDRLWLLPAATFLVGLALGAVLIWVARPSDGDGATSAAAPSPGATTGAGAGSATAAPGATDGPGGASPVTVTVPQSCVRLAQTAQQATALLDDAATAARETDAGALAGLVRRMGTLRDELGQQASSCTADVGPVSLPSPAPTTSSG